jgi:hypothetical protein
MAGEGQVRLQSIPYRNTLACTGSACGLPVLSCRQARSWDETLHPKNSVSLRCVFGGGGSRCDDLPSFVVPADLRDAAERGLPPLLGVSPAPGVTGDDNQRAAVPDGVVLPLSLSISSRFVVPVVSRHWLSRVHRMSYRLPASTVSWQRGKSKRDDGSIGNPSCSMPKYRWGPKVRPLWPTTPRNSPLAIGVLAASTLGETEPR